jgi:cation diffusion facilitator CzcD-associated flavoprotein CzcO
MSQDKTHFQIAIIGSGFGGLGMAIQLKKAGFEDFVIFERASDVGGTWRDNTYPGCACDVQSHLYSFSFALNPDWSRMYSPQPEIWAYLQRCAKDFNILPSIRFGHEIKEIVWDNVKQYWLIKSSQGNYSANILVGGVGALCEPSMPEIKGIESFEGKIFHSARWDHNYDLTGRSVAVIGTGASAIQFVPKIQPKVAKLNLFQRTPPWIIPRQDRKITDFEHKLFRQFPITQHFMRAAIYLTRETYVMYFRHPYIMKINNSIAKRYLEKSVADAKLRAKLTPNYLIGCKRILISNDYFQSLCNSNVEVITDSISEIRPNSIVAKDGVERQIDTIILGTGFHVTDLPFAKIIRGREGKTLDETWNGAPKAHLGTTIAGFPNFFLLLGPNTGLGHNSVVYMIECQIAHIISALNYMRQNNIATVEPRAEAQAAFVSQVEQKMQGTVWTSGGCASWYLDSTGRNSTLWPTFTWLFKSRLAQFKPLEYVMTG